MRTMIDCITSRRCWLILGVLALIATMMALTPGTALAQNNCLQDEYNLVNKQTLNCTANDVRVAKVINIRGLDGKPFPTCDAGSNINFIADYLITTTSNAKRSNIGLYFDTGNVNTQTNALSGSCSDNIIWPVKNPPGSACGSDTSVVCGTTTTDEFDASPDNCGDTSSTDPTVCLDANNNVVSCTGGAATQTFTSTQIVTVEIHNFPCVAPTGGATCTVDGFTGPCLVLPNCTSWQIPGKTLLCESSASYYPYPFNGPGGTPTAIPGSPSKCNCETIPLGIVVQNPSVDVGKACNTSITNTPSTPTFDFTTNPATASPDNCDAGIEGASGPVTYTVAVHNSSNTGGVTVNQICDNVYGTVYRSASAPSGLATCSAGSRTITTNNCSSGVNWDIGQGATQTCTFVASTTGLEPPNTIQDVVSVTGAGDNSGTAFGPSNSAQVTVYAEEAPSTANVNKSFIATEAACATVRYKVDVSNTTSATYDETLSLTALNDTSFGNITALGTGSAPVVLGTTCGVAAGAPGLGTLNTYAVVGPGTAVTTGHLPGGVLPDTLTSGGADYVCYFEAQFCGSVASISTTGGGTCSGITNSDTVNPTITSDESESLSGACSTGNTGTPGVCTAGNVGASCTSNSACNSITTNTVTVNECITSPN